MRYFKKITGSRVYLSPMNPDDVEQYTKWMNDPEVTRFLGQRAAAISLRSEAGFLENASQEGHNYAIVLHEGDRLIGNISLMDIHTVHRRATVGLFIGEAEDRSKGYGTEALRLILDYGFNAMNLNNIMLQVSAENARGIACYNKVGFSEFGRRKDAEFTNGHYADEVYMQILAAEFNAQ